MKEEEKKEKKSKDTLLTSREQEGFEYELPEGEQYEEEDRERKKKKAVIKRILNDCYQYKLLEKDKLEVIQRDYMMAGNVQEEISISEAIHSQFTFSAVKKVKQKIKFPSWELKMVEMEGEEDMSEDTKAINRAILLDGTKKLISIAGIARAFNGKGGIKQRAILNGDCFFIVKWDPKGKKVVWEIVEFDNIFFEKRINAIRNAPTGMTAGKFIITYDFDDFDTFRNEVKDVVDDETFEKICWGEVPIKDTNKDISDTWEQDQEDRGKKGQMLILFDLDNEKEEWYAGQNLYPIFEKKSWEYKIDVNGDFGESVLPIFHISMFDRTAGLFSDGLGHLCSERNGIDTALRQANTASLIRDASGLSVLNVPKGGKDDAQEALNTTMNEFKDGIGSGVAIVESDTNSPPMKVESLFRDRTNTDGVNFITNQNQNDLVALGINVRDVSSDPNKTAFAVGQDNIASSELASETILQWSDELCLALELTFSLAKRMIKKDDKRRFKAYHTVISDKENQAKDRLTMEGLPRSAIETRESVTKATLGEWSKLAQTTDFEVEIIADSGIRPDTTVQREKNLQMFQVLAGAFQGMPIVNKVAKHLLESYGIQATEDDFVPKQQQPQEQMGGMGVPQGQIGGRGVPQGQIAPSLP